ncbi:MAG: hypothetical protein V3W20_10965, partial [Candidatus Neomarinimicrobiota bacterium]
MFTNQNSCFVYLPKNVYEILKEHVSITKKQLSGSFSQLARASFVYGPQVFLTATVRRRGIETAVIPSAIEGLIDISNGLGYGTWKKVKASNLHKVQKNKLIFKSFCAATWITALTLVLAYLLSPDEDTFMSLVAMLLLPYLKIHNNIERNQTFIGSELLAALLALGRGAGSILSGCIILLLETFGITVKLFHVIIARIVNLILNNITYLSCNHIIKKCYSTSESDNELQQNNNKEHTIAYDEIILVAYRAINIMILGGKFAYMPQLIKDAFAYSAPFNFTLFMKTTNAVTYGAFKSFKDKNPNDPDDLKEIIKHARVLGINLLIFNSIFAIGLNYSLSFAGKISSGLHNAIMGTPKITTPLEEISQIMIPLGLALSYRSFTFRMAHMLAGKNKWCKIVLYTGETIIFTATVAFLFSINKWQDLLYTSLGFAVASNCFNGSFILGQLLFRSRLNKIILQLGE